MRRNIHDFIFLGGSTRIDRRSKEPSASFSECARELVGGYPSIFPEGCDPLKGTDTSIVDIPITGDFMRCFCVYFCVSTGRSFWNVLCFSYSVKDWSKDDLQCALALSAREWNDLALTLREDQSYLSLPDCPANKKVEIENWLPDGIFARDFPVSSAQGLTESMPYENVWRALLQLPRRKFHVPPPSMDPIPFPTPPKPQQRCLGFLLGLFLGILLGGLAFHVLSRYDKKNRVSHSDTIPSGTQPRPPRPTDFHPGKGRWIIEISPYDVKIHPVISHTR